MSSPWIVRLGQVGTPRIRLLCIPQAGGGPVTFQPLAPELRDDIELLALRPPGRESRRRETSIRDMGQTVTAVLAALEEYQDVPLALFGYCSGAYLMMEVAREIIRARQISLRRLFACGACGPMQVDRTRRVYAMQDAEFKDYLGACGIMPAVILEDPSLLSLFAPAIRADFETWETAPYLPGQPMAVPITVIGGRADPVVDVDELLEWREHTADEFTMRIFPGGHGFFSTGVKALGAAITMDLRE